MRSSAKFTLSVFAGPAVFCLLAGGALAATRDPLVIPGIGPQTAPTARHAAYRPHRAPAPAPLAYAQPRYAPAAYAAPRRSVARYWMQEAPPRPVRVASFAPRFEGPAWEAPRYYDDEYRPAAYNGADAYPPPPRPYLVTRPFARVW